MSGLQKEVYAGKIVLPAAQRLMDIKSELKNALKGNVTIVGIGNAMKGDDGFGPALCRRLKGKVRASVIDAGVSPENYTKKIKDTKPDTILIVDAADIGEPAGALKLLKKSDVPVYGISTHNASVAMLMDFLTFETKADIFILAAQPQECRLGHGISKALADTLHVAEAQIRDILALC